MWRVLGNQTAPEPVREMDLSQPLIAHLEWFGLTERPFAITPNPRFLYFTAQHREAVAHLLYSLRDGSGFTLLTGEVGTGKTTLSRWLLGAATGNVEFAYIINPRLTPVELLAAICDELRIPVPLDAPGTKPLLDLLTARLLENHAAGRLTVLIIDEAQNLGAELLEQVRLLTNLETAERKLLQIFLIGQPELRAILARPELRQLSQRITARYHLDHLNRRETACYVLHRLAVAGRTALLFTAGGLRQVYSVTRGVPRLINLVCERALIGAYSTGSSEIGASLVRRCAREVIPPRFVPRSKGWWLGGGVGVALLAAGVIGGWLPQGVQGNAASGRVEILLPPPVVKETIRPAIAAVVAAGNESPKEVASPGSPPPAGVSPEGVSMEQAYATLFEVWKLAPPGAGGDPCDALQEARFLCHQFTGNLGRVRTLDLPVILQLVGSGSGFGYGVLTSLADGRARLRLGAREVELTTEELERRWTGQVNLIWPPLGWPLRNLELGASGEDVLRLRNSLIPAHSPADGADGLRFDAALQQAVIRFQQRNGLKPDGVVGPATFMLLLASDPVKWNELPHLATR